MINDQFTRTDDEKDDGSNRSNIELERLLLEKNIQRNINHSRVAAEFTHPKRPNDLKMNG